MTALLERMETQAITKNLPHIEHVRGLFDNLSHILDRVGDSGEPNIFVSREGLRGLFQLDSLTRLPAGESRGSYSDRDGKQWEQRIKVRRGTDDNPERVFIQRVNGKESFYLQYDHTDIGETIEMRHREGMQETVVNLNEKGDEYSVSLKRDITCDMESETVFLFADGGESKKTKLVSGSSRTYRRR